MALPRGPEFLQPHMWLSYQLLPGPELVLCGRVPAFSRAVEAVWCACALSLPPLSPGGPVWPGLTLTGLLPEQNQK